MDEILIINIMESWPLQLVIRTDSGLEQVVLAEDAIIHRGRFSLDPGALQPGQFAKVLKKTMKGEIAELEIL